MIERARNNIAERGDAARDSREGRRSRRCASSFIQLVEGVRELSSKYGPEHPKMKALTGQMDSVRKAYEEEIDGVLATFEKTYQELRRQRALAEGADGAAEEGGDRAVEDRGRVQAAAARRRAEHEDVQPHREPAEGDRHHRPDEDEQRARARARDRARRAGAAEAGAEPDARPAARPRHRHRAGVRHRGARQHAEDAGGRRAVPGRAGAGPGADHRRGAPARRRRRRATTCASATWACSSIRSRSRPSAAGRSARTSCSCRRIARCGPWSSPARARRKARRRPPSTWASRWPRRAAAC